MAIAESIEGTAGPVWFHYDLSGDVLYLRLISARDVAASGEEDDSGLVVLRDQQTDRVVGMTIVNWWKRFGAGQVPDSVRDLAARIDPWAQKAQAAA
jgi:hypothetical protein